MKLLARSLSLAALLGIANVAHAQMIVNIFQNGPDVNMVASGSINLSGLRFSSIANNPSLIAPTIATLLVGGNGSYTVYRGLSGPSSFGSGGLTIATSGSGDRFAIENDANHFIAVPFGYFSGSPINGSAVFANNTLSNLGLTLGTYNFTLPNSSITVNIGPVSSAVPEPGSIALLVGVGISGGVMLKRCRNRR